MSGRFGQDQGQVQCDLHTCALVQGTVQVQRSAHELTQAAADDQAQPSALARRLRTDLGKMLEQALLIFAADADAAVYDLQHNLQLSILALVKPKADLDAALIGEFDCIAYQVREDLLETQRIDQDQLLRGLQIAFQSQPFEPGIAFEYPHGRADQGIEVGRLRRQRHVPGFDTGDVENVADQFQHAIGRLECHL
ncbi:hypothetical protein D3C77_340450 [compost metagenome]